MNSNDKSLFSEAISHAYIFLGPEEVAAEKALFFARKINCENTDFAPCGYCNSCRKILNKTNPDVFEIFPDGASIKIEQVRNVIASFSKRPTEAIYRVCIFHLSQKMTLQAQNALLKTLEEPITNSIAILLADNTEHLLPTVVSRCQIYDFVSSGGFEHQLEPEVRKKLAGILKSISCEKLDVYKAVSVIEDTDKNAEEILEFILSLYRDVMVVKTKSKIDIVNNRQIDEINSIAAVVDLAGIINAIQITISQIKAAKGRGNVNLIWHNLLLGLMEVM
ncbi:MAG: hypothetical protein GX759_05825 [Thermoanaerobacterales bacterium]|nr:hypothetical protein [Thermoanaerobacterales bacterium]